MNERCTSGWLLATGMLALGILGAGWFVGHGLVAMKAADRAVAVKGLSEREVQSNLALWNVAFTVTGRDLTEAQGKLAAHADAIRAYLEKSGIAADAIQQGALKVTDRQANQYQNASGGDDARYILSSVLKVRSANIEAVQQASRRIGDVVRDAGVVLGAPDQYGCDLRLIYTKLNEIKPGMIAEATQDARRAAEQFAKDSGVRVGAIQQASQGYFSVSSRDGSDLNSDSGSCEAETSEVKKVRVVTNVTYFLE